MDAQPTAHVAVRIPEDPHVEAVDFPTGQSILVRELTVAEVRAWITETAAQSWRDPVHALAFADLGLDELARMTDASVEELEQYAPSQLDPVMAVARRLNPHFFRLRDALIQASRQSDAPPQAKPAESQMT